MHSPTPNDNSLYDNVDSLITACSMGFDDELKTFIAHSTHLKDERGSALYAALSAGHVECVKLLKKAGVVISNKHYYAAGIAGAAKGPTLYDIIKPGQATRTHQSSAHDPLFHAIRQGNIMMMRPLLENKTPVEPEHFYAAGRYFDKNISSTQTTCKRMFELLKSFKENTPLPDNFYTEQEQELYSELDQEAKAASKPSFA